MDLLVDFFCVAFPLCVLYFVTGLPVTVETMLQIMFLPTLGIYNKLNAVQRQFIVEDLRSMRYDAEKEASIKAARRHEFVWCKARGGRHRGTKTVFHAYDTKGLWHLAWALWVFPASTPHDADCSTSSW